MKNNDIFDFIGETAPFGDEIGIVTKCQMTVNVKKDIADFARNAKRVLRNQ